MTTIVPTEAPAGRLRVLLEASLARESRHLQTIGRLEADVSRLQAVAAQTRHERDELSRVNQEQTRRLDVLTKQVEALTAKVMVTPKTSATSSLPPSSDDVETKNSRRYPAREKTTKKTGGQPGHAGTTLAWDIPDETRTHRPQRCKAGHDLHDAPVIKVDSRQVLDVVIIPTRIQHDYETVKCAACRQKVRLDPQQQSRLSYGPGVVEVGLDLTSVGLLPLEAAANLLEAITGYTLSTGTLDAWRSRAAEALDSFDAALVEELKTVPVLGADETPIRVDKDKLYVHAAVTDLFTRFHLADRSTNGATAGGILGGHDGVLVSDRWGPYWSITAGPHQTCWAHLIRELRYFLQSYAPTKGGDPDPSRLHPHPELAAILELARESIHQVNQHLPWDSTIPDQVNALADHLAKKLKGARLVKELPDLDHKCRNLMLALIKHQDDLWHYTQNPAVPPTNNLSEQAVRPLKVRQRRSGCFRSADAARQTLRILSYLDTARKHGISQTVAMNKLVTGKPWLPPTPANPDQT